MEIELGEVLQQMVLDEVEEGSLYQSVKLPLKSVVRNVNFVEIFNEAVVRMDRLTSHTYRFLKLYLLIQFENAEPLQRVTPDFVYNIMVTIGTGGGGGRQPNEATLQLRELLLNFHNASYRPTMVDQNEIISYVNLTQVMRYESLKIVTAYENNIKQHFVQYVERYVNVCYEKKRNVSEIENTVLLTAAQKLQAKRLLFNQLRLIKNDILNHRGNILSTENEFVTLSRLLLPDRELIGNRIKEDIKVYPQDYLYAMIAMMRVVERDFEETVLNVFPLKTSIIPGHYTFDTFTILELFYRRGVLGLARPRTYGRADQKSLIWNRVVKNEYRAFNGNRAKPFNFMIQTDGYSCSILRIRRDCLGVKFGRIPTAIKNPVEGEEPYIHRIGEVERLYLQFNEFNLVAIDPGKEDLLYCVNGAGRDQIKFRYSQNQRRKETKVILLLILLSYLNTYMYTR